MNEVPSTQSKEEPLLARVDSDVLVYMQVKVKLYSIGQFALSLLFWIWALVNILRGKGFDAGVVSFVFPFLAGFFGYLSTSKQNRILFATLHLGLTGFGHILVTLNYIGGVLVAGVTLGFRVYCIIFAVLWFISWIICSIWAMKWRKMLQQYSDINYDSEIDVSTSASAL